MIGLQLYKIVSGVRFGKEKTKLSAGPSGIRFDFGHFEEDLLDVHQHPVRLVARGARWRRVVEDKSSFVHLRHEPATDLRIEEVCCREDHEHHSDRDPAKSNKPSYHASVCTKDPAGFS